MNKYIAKFKNWWNPIGYETRKEIVTYNFIPLKNITAYEMYRCQKQPWRPYQYQTASEYEESITTWYNNLPNKCKRHLEVTSQSVIEYKKYE